MQLVCAHCGAINRIPSDRPAEQGKCGKCAHPLFNQQPLNVTQSQFDRHLHKTQIPLVVDFWADWCGPCKMMAPAFQQAAVKIEPRALLLKVNTEQEQGLSARYAIRSIPTLMVFSAGQEVARMSGAMDLGNLLSWINNHI